MTTRTKVSVMAMAGLLIGSVLLGAARTSEGHVQGPQREDRLPPVPQRGAHWGAVFTIRPDGTRERQVTLPPEGYVDRNPDVSPDGRRIVFERELVECDDVCTEEIFVVDVDGRNLTQLTNHPTDRDCLVGNAARSHLRGRPTGKNRLRARSPGRSSTTWSKRSRFTS